MATKIQERSWWNPWALAVVVLFAYPGILGAAEPFVSSAEKASAGEILDVAGVNGGLIVHVGCGDGKLTAALRANQSYLVHGLDTDMKNVASARAHIQSLGLYGPVSVERWAGERLPYADNLVNLLVVEDAEKTTKDEMMRVLAPNGVAVVKKGDSWSKTVKPWPDGMDEWTHWRHGADGNPVANDVFVSPPRHLQWIAKPLWAKHHNMTINFSAMVTAKGRVFYIQDDTLPGIISMPQRWCLFARDAFNSTLLWKRPIPQWGWPAWGSGTTGSRFDQPVDIMRRLVAVDDHVYAALGFNAPLSKIDAKTGETIRTYPRSEGLSEVLYHQGQLIVSVHRRPEAAAADGPFGKHILLFDAASGKLLWEKEGLSGILVKSGPLSRFTSLFMAASDNAVFLADKDSIVCLDLKDGKERWRRPRPPQQQIVSSYFKSYIGNITTLIARQDILLFSQILTKPSYRRVLPYSAMESQLVAYSPTTGEKLWQYDGGSYDYDSPNNAFFIDGLIWTIARGGFKLVGLDPKSGTVKKEFSVKEVMDTGHHHRCYPAKATAHYVLTGRRGIEFLDIRAGKHVRNHWIRGVCRYGFMPANGLLYAPPDPCSCYQSAKVNGLVALSGKRDGIVPAQVPERLQKGPAFGKIRNAKPKIRKDDWPTYRHDTGRTGTTDAVMPAEIGLSWQTKIGGKLSSVTVAQGKVFVASVDTHALYALNEDTGKEAWRRTVGAPIDTPPTICQGLALFGSADGYVYALRAKDGELVWRLRAAPCDRRIVAFGNLESPWPVHGSVLVKKDVAYATAGRSSFLDGGIFVYAIDPATGKILQQRTLYSVDPKTGEVRYSTSKAANERYDMPSENPGALSDVLVSDDKFFYMRHTKMELSDISNNSVASTDYPNKYIGPLVTSNGGLLDDSWFNLTHWSYANASPCRLLVCDDRCTYGVKAYKRISRHGGVKFDARKDAYYLFADDRSGKVKRIWVREIPIRVMAMVAGRDSLFAAGTPHVIDPDDPWAAFEGRRGGRLRVVSKKNGETLADYRLDSPPVWDGMAAAAGRLYLSAVDGKVYCFGAN